MVDTPVSELTGEQDVETSMVDTPVSELMKKKTSKKRNDMEEVTTLSNYILTSDGKLYHCDVSESELYHYGVPGMKWGVRRASKLQQKATTARASAKEWEEMAKYAMSKGKAKRAEKYRRNAAEDMADADKYQKKADRKVEKRYAKAGKAAGQAEYYRDKAAREYEKHESDAKVFDKAAKQYDSKGQLFRAEAARKAAQALRARGANIRDGHINTADSYLRRSGKLNAKASDFATKTSIGIGKKKIDSILKSSKKKGYDQAKSADEFQRERELEDKLGERRYAAYNKLRGKS